MQQNYNILCKIVNVLYFIYSDMFQSYFLFKTLHYIQSDKTILNETNFQEIAFKN